MPAQVYLVVGLFLLLGLALAWMGLRRIFGRQKISGSINTLIGLCLILAAIGSLGAVTNLYTYQRLTAEEPVGSLSFEQYAPQEFVATFTLPEAAQREFSVYGDECQLDARILKWKGTGNLLGFDTLYRLERLSGRYRNVEEENSKTRTVHALAEQAGVEVWTLAKKFDRWLPWVDAVYGDGVYIPMKHKARYRISMTNSGLIARPDNKIAEQAVANWR